MKLYNTMSRSIEEFVPIVPGKASMYCCGPTVYNYAHIGNLRTYIFEDLLHRTLERSGLEVCHVMNITDVGHLTGDGDDGEDKMEKSARESGRSVWDIARFYTDAFFSDEKDGNVYFSIDSIDDYGKLARLDLDELKSGARIDIDSNKRNPKDFVLWFTNSKFKDQAMMWDSPWGRGYPGWHIECSAMSMKYLGEHFDIHCGGIDAIPVHHTNEIAQSEAATGHVWVNYWCHGEFLLNDSGKMSKSSGEFLTLSVLKEKGYDPLDYRYFCLSGHYRSQLKFSFEALDHARAARRNLFDKIAQLKAEGEAAKEPGEKAMGYMRAFDEAMENDLSAPQALSQLWLMLKDDIPSSDKLAAAYHMDGILGLGLEGIEASCAETVGGEEERKLLEERSAAKKARDFARADEIRDILLERGFIVRDTPQGPVLEKRV